MTRSQVAWVQSVACVLAEDAAAVLVFVREAPDGFWERASVVDGWTNRDLLAHMGGGNDQMVQVALRAVIEGRELDPAALEPDTDGENAARVAERRGWRFVDVLGEYERGVAEMQDLLAGLKAEHEATALGGTKLTLGKLLRIVEHERHDHLHLEQLRAGMTPKP